MQSVATRLIRVVLWLLLIGLPVLYCLVFIIFDFNISFGIFGYGIEYSPQGTIDIYDASSTGTADISRFSLKQLIVYLAWLRPFWIAIILSLVCIFVGIFFNRISGYRFLFSTSNSVQNLAAQLIFILLLTYILGTIIHFASAPLLNDQSYSFARPEYWWPFYSAEGWTIYPPLSTIPTMPPLAEAACFKLATLLTLLFARHKLLRRTNYL